MDGRRGYPRVDNGIRGASTFKEPPTLGWMERDRIRALELNAHGELGRQVAKPRGIVTLDLPANQYEEVAVKRVSNGITAARGLMRWAPRLLPYAQAFAFGWELGDWLFDQTWPQVEPVVSTVTGTGNGYLYDIPADWRELWSTPDTGGEMAWDTHFDTTGQLATFGTFDLPLGSDIQDSTSGGVMFDHVPYDGRAYSLQDVIDSREISGGLYYQNPIGQLARYQVIPGVTPGTLGDDLFRFSPRIQYYQPVGVTSVPTLQASSSPTMTSPEVDPKVPYKAIPYQDAWSNPFTSRGNSVEPKLQSVPAALVSTSPGTSYYAEVSADGSVRGGSFVPPVDTLPKPPGPRVKEKKGFILTGGGPGRLFGTVTEIGDMIKCAFDAIPARQRIKDKVRYRLPEKAQKTFMGWDGELRTKVYANVGLWRQAKYVATHFDDVNFHKFTACMQEAILTDAAIGIPNQIANAKLVANQYWLSPKGIGLGSGLSGPRY